MKFYNIKNTKSFIDRLTSVCKGSVELIGEDGLHLELTDGTMSSDMIPLSYLTGSISKMEVKFNCADDCLAMTYYMMNQKAS